MPPCDPETAHWFAEHVHPHESALRGYLHGLVSPAEIDDLVQETYARLLRISDPRRLVHARAFLFTTARNVAIDHVRRTRRTPVDPIDHAGEIALFDPTPGAAEVLDQAVELFRTRYEGARNAYKTMFLAGGGIRGGRLLPGPAWAEVLGPRGTATCHGPSTLEGAPGTGRGG